MLSYSFNQIGVFAEYIMDIEQFTELYCVNKDKPDLKCNGKCHLVKQLADNEEQNHKKDVQAPPEILLFYVTSQVEVDKHPELPVEKKNTFYFNENLTEGFNHRVFNPPQHNFI